MPTRLLQFTLALCCACLGHTAFPAEIPPADDLLSHLHKQHPRLLATSSQFADLKTRIDRDDILRRWHADLQRQAQQILSAAPSRYEIPDGLRLLSTSRRVLYRVQTLGLLYQLDGGDAYLNRAWQELDAAAHFPDWNPRHFLDTAEMSHAFAIGYDWLYSAWTPEQKSAIRDALVSKGLSVGLAGYRGENRFGGWAKARHNWNQVCNGGLGIAALAIADDNPELARSILKFALDSIQIPMKEFAPDGAWAEGPGYWNYATSYNVSFLAALQSALGTDFGLASIPGFSETGFFPIHLTGPLGRTFNYADGGDGRIRAPQLFWLANQFHQPAFAQYELALSSPHPLDLLWFGLSKPLASSMPAPLDRYFRNAEIACFRSRWDDPKALFLGFKAGDNKANHSHLDLGTFVMDALGHRWATDLGADNYNLPGYFGKQRWQYYRLRTEGHNTVVLNPSEAPGQKPTAAARIVRFNSTPKSAFAIADLSAAYADSAQRAERGIALLDRRGVLLQDEIQTSAPSRLFWFFHTPAEIQIDRADPSAAVLRQDGARLWAKILSPDSAHFQSMPAAPLPQSPHPEGQADNRGVKKLALDLDQVQQARIAVYFLPLRPDDPIPMPTALPTVRPLENW